MLKNVTLTYADSTCSWLSKGIYLCRHFNFEMEFRDQNFDLDYPTFESDPNFNCYGVCDDSDQLMKALPQEVTEGPKDYVISLHVIHKGLEPEKHGWRWHKWGPYIGIHEPQCEYIADEPVIEKVFVYHIYQVA